ncbi:MAG TPA: alpha/beta family hydrolase [Mycobacteriales bacterium]|nr:alpha/beta family hydrolase [Mycobacteriales bacterium]
MAAASLDARSLEVDTPSGPAHVALSKRGKTGLYVVGHGAGGGIDAVDLVAVSTALVAAGWTVARVVQPYRVKGRRAPEPPPRLDAAWAVVLDALRKERAGRLVVSGRSSGARVAVRTAEAVGADAVVALAFPLHPPGKPEKSRADELIGLKIPHLIVQGERDAFGAPAEFPSRANVVGVPGDHSLKQAPDRVAATVIGWLNGM